MFSAMEHCKSVTFLHKGLFGFEVDYGVAPNFFQFWRGSVGVTFRF